MTTHTINAVVMPQRHPRPLPPLRESYTPRFIPQYATLTMRKDGLHWLGELTARSPQTGRTIRVQAVRHSTCGLAPELIEKWYRANEAQQPLS